MYIQWTIIDRFSKMEKSIENVFSYRTLIPHLVTLHFPAEVGSYGPVRAMIAYNWNNLFAD